MINDYFKIIINRHPSNKIICLFINNIDEREKAKQNIKFNKTPSNTEIKNPSELKKYLTTQEINAIGTEFNICVSDYVLLNDDTVEELKLKVFFTLKSLNISINVESAYIFVNSFSKSSINFMKEKNTSFDKIDYLYRILSHNKKSFITWDILCELFLNCGNIGLELIKKFDKKMYYFYDDFNEHRELIEKIKEYYVPVSHYLTTHKQRIAFISNPDTLLQYFNVLLQTTTNVFNKDFNAVDIHTKFFEVSKLVTENTDEILSTNNSKCLYDFYIENNTIHLFTLFDINEIIPDLEKLQNKQVIKYITSMYISFYFPRLKDIFDDYGKLNREKYNKNIELLEKKITDNKKRYTDYFNKLETTYSINKSIIEKNNKYTSIKQLSGVYYQEFPFVFPCESIFKKVKTTQVMPFSKYNPGKKQENINRLYVSGISSKGKKVPYLTKSLIQKINSKIGTKENIMYYFNVTPDMFNEYTNKNTPKYTRELIEQLINKIPIGNYELYIVIYNDSSISYNFSCGDIAKSMGLNEINYLFTIICNPVLLFIKNELLTMGPIFNVMESLNTNNFEIQNINLEFLFENIKISQLDFDKFVNCVSKYISKQETLQKVTSANRLKFMYKRISNYTKLNAIESSIIQFINVGYGEQTIVKFLETNYGIDELEAKQSFLNVLSQISIERSINPNRRLRIKNNPGLIFDFVDVPFSNNLIVEVNNINTVDLIELIKHNTETILTLLSNNFVNKEEQTKISKICKKTTTKKDDFNLQDEIKDKTSVVEQAIDLNQPSEQLTKNLLEAKMNAQAITFDDIDQLNSVKSLDEALDSDLMELLVGEDDEEGIGNIINDAEVEEAASEPTSILEKQKSITKEDDDLDEVDEPDELDMLGGSDGADIVGMSLTNPNPFFNKMYNLDPKLFLKQKTGQFNAYSRMCPWNVKRQPVILTQEELDKIDKEYPGSYNKKIKYGSSPDKQYYYICPRYWCLKDNISLTEEQVKAGACGGVDAIIPKNAKKVPPGKYIFEFYADAEHKHTDGSYIEHYPGFLAADKHPDGLCVPCCFKTWDSEMQKKRREECAKPSGDDTELDLKYPEVQTKADDELRDTYIMGVDKFPLPNNRWAMLPVEIQTFLNIDNNYCFDDIETHKLKYNTKCILRQGIELSQNKSFIGAIANVYSTFLESGRIMTIENMSKHIASSITLDHFIESQNGSLVSMFFNDKTFKNIDELEINKHKDTNVYKLTDFNNLSQVIYLKRAISAFNKFKMYIKNQRSHVDHEILWDIVSMPNPNLFINGLNLVILNIPEDDITNNVEILCPTNAYSSMFYNPRKFTFILIKKNEFYEPIYTYEQTEQVIKIDKLFTEFSPKLLPALKEFIDTIKEFINECRAKQNAEYSKIFEKSNTVNDIVRIVGKEKGTIINYILNYSKKIVGIAVDFERNKKSHKNIYIPCLPTSLKLSNLKDDDKKMLISYDEFKPQTLEQTYNGLVDAHNLSSKINSKPYSFVNEDNMIVGIITNTNQFVATKPIESTSPVVKTYSKNMNTIFSYDNTTLNTHLSNYMEHAINKDRININDSNSSIYDKYKLSALEQHSFQRFRNKIKVLLQMPKHKSYRDAIILTTESESLQYKTKLHNIIKTIQELTKNSVEFYPISEFEKYANEINLNKNTNVYYVEDLTKTILPKNNLSSPVIDNSIYYYERISDELIRFSRIYDFLINNQYNVGYLNVDFNLRENELLIPSSELDQSFFQDIADISKYYDVIYSLDFFNAQPQIKIKISDVFTKKKTLIKLKARREAEKKYDEQPEVVLTETINGNICNIIKTDTLGTTWKSLLGKRFKTNKYEQSVNCSYQVLIDIIKIHSNIDVTIDKLRDNLINIYTNFNQIEKEEFISLLSKEGKIEIARKINTNIIQLQDTPLLSDYYLSLPEIALLSKEYKLPLIIITSGTFKYLNTNVVLTSSLQFNDKTNGKPNILKTSPANFFILKRSGIKRNQPFIYDLFIHHDKNIQLNASMLTNKFIDFIQKHINDTHKYEYTMLNKLLY